LLAQKPKVMSEVEMEQKNNNNGAFIAIILLLLLGLGAMAYLWSSKNSKLNDCHNENTVLKSDIDGMNQMMAGYVDNMSNDLRSDFQSMLDTYDQLKIKDKKQADSIDAQKAKIQGIMDELAKNKKISASQLFQMKKENETLRKIMKSYVLQIDSLNTLNLRLNSDLDQTTNKLNVTSEERDQYKKDAESSQEQVKKGSKLSAFNFTSGGLRMKLNNTTEETTRARNCVQFRANFTVSENPLTPAGKKMVYMQIVNPDGKTFQYRTSSTVQTDQGPIAYSDKKEIDYQNQRVDLSIFYDLQGEEALKGNYKVNVYCDGQQIGTDSFTLK
jgi:hypothetical protein